MIERIILGVIRRLRKYITVPVFSFIEITIFFLRDYLFGNENSANYLRKVNKPSIVPILRLKGAEIGSESEIESGLILHNCRNYKNLKIGKNCHIGKNCFLDLSESVEICDNVVIAMNNTFITHLDLGKCELKINYPSQVKKIIIRDHVYIGCNSTVLMGVTINQKALIGSNSLVNRDIDENTFNYGIPTRTRA